MLELRRLEEVFYINPTTDISSELETKRQLLQRLRESRVVGAIIRSRAGWHELGEKNSSYFLNIRKDTMYLDK